MTALLETLNNFLTLPPALEQELKKTWRMKALAKGRHWLKAGDDSNDFVFIEKGLMKTYMDTGIEKQATLSFYKEPDFIIPSYSASHVLYKGVAVKALGPTTLWYADKAGLWRICECFPIFNHHVNIIARQNLSISEAHILLLLLPGTERYRYLLHALPWALWRLNDREIAAYIGITPATLCRLKRFRLKKV